MKNNEGFISKRSDGVYMKEVFVLDSKTGKKKKRTFYGKTQKEVLEKILKKDLLKNALEY